ncbi:MAG: Stealth CR1 domain-containing protein [Eubacterium sp.]|nr:Stealth CR1 domain-containing protein [Eubacterium sp.]
MNEKIDFVITWVDGDDGKWRELRDKFQSDVNDTNEIRYRDWGTLKYWFRGIEKYAPWVNDIYFVTWGHLPDWLNTDHPKIKIVKHEDFIPEEYLPTFSSHTIELNLHRIKGLSDKFVYFNDDTFLINSVRVEDFFVKGLPCDIATLYPNIVSTSDDMFDHIQLNVSELFSRNFDIKKVIRDNRGSWYTLRYGKNVLKTMMLSPFPQFPGIVLTHQPISYLKKTFQEVWERENDSLNKTCLNKFRTINDVNQYVFRYWQIGKGDFHPYNILKRGEYVSLEAADLDYNMLLSIKKPVLCINDTSDQIDFISEKKKLTDAFQQRFPEKSSFEK